MALDEKYTTAEWQQHAEASIKLSQERRKHPPQGIRLSRGQKGALGLLGLAVWCAFVWYVLLWAVTALFV